MLGAVLAWPKEGFHWLAYHVVHIIIWRRQCLRPRCLGQPTVDWQGGHQRQDLPHLRGRRQWNGPWPPPENAQVIFFATPPFEQANAPLIKLSHDLLTSQMTSQTTHHPTNWPDNRPTNQTINPLINHTTRYKRPTNQSPDPLTGRPTDSLISQMTSQPTH